MSHARALLFAAIWTGIIVALGFGISACKGDFPEFKKMPSYYDGTKVITLEQGQKLVNVTWKVGTVWYLVRPMRPGELPERYEFHEDSPLEGVHGQVIIQEKASAFPQQ